MSFDQALRRYGKERFTDRDVTRCTGLSQRAWRELMHLGAVRTITEDRGRGVVRICDATVLKRAAVIAALNRAGWSLAASGQIAYFVPHHWRLYYVCDPLKILPHKSEIDWFDPDKPAKADPESDWLLEIYQGRFVGGIYQSDEPPMFFGDLRDKGANFVAWLPLRRRVPRMGRVIEAFAEEMPSAEFLAAWEDPIKWTRELRQLGYKYEKHDRDDDLLCKAAEAATRSPDFKVTVNITLVIRKALRRFLGIEPAGPFSESGSK